MRCWHASGQRWPAALRAFRSRDLSASAGARSSVGRSDDRFATEQANEYVKSCGIVVGKCPDTGGSEGRLRCVGCLSLMELVPPSSHGHDVMRRHRRRSRVSLFSQDSSKAWPAGLGWCWVGPSRQDQDLSISFYIYPTTLCATFQGRRGSCLERHQWAAAIGERGRGICRSQVILRAR